ncbi:MAG: ATP-binding cassette domain-containing protein [Gammaproteobacteria bacterium]|nr:ATP-binding cassette domain-containing protein [Gammaproteobacteria bacterium]
MATHAHATNNSETEHSALVGVTGLYKEFPVVKSFLDELAWEDGRLRRHKESVKALNGIDFAIRRKEALCLVGESGCGKSTVARVIMGLLKPTTGKIYYDGQRIDDLTDQGRLGYRNKMQMVFQNPYASLNPRMTVQQTLEEPIRFHYPQLNAEEVRDRVAEVMQSVGNDPSWGERYPHEFSGGQRQRVSIARALMVDPEFVVADEPISALDVSIQAQVLNLMMEAQQNRGLTYLFITHDLSVVEHFGSRVAVMYLGTICELAAVSKLFAASRHPYTQALLSARPKLQDERPQHIKLIGEVPTPIDLPSGCVFHGRCPHANERCKQEIPRLRAVDHEAQVACHAVEEGRL